MPTRRVASRRAYAALAVGAALAAFTALSPAHAQTGMRAKANRTAAARPAPTSSTTAAPAPAVDAAASEWIPDLAPLAARAAIGLRDVVERYDEDRGALGRRYDGEYSPSRRDALRAFDRTWLERLADLDFDALEVEGRVTLPTSRGRRPGFGSVDPYAPYDGSSRDPRRAIGRDRRVKRHFWTPSRPNQKRRK